MPFINTIRFVCSDGMWEAGLFEDILYYVPCFIYLNALLINSLIYGLFTDTVSSSDN
jgi:hypothetical protein